MLKTSKAIVLLRVSLVLFVLLPLLAAAQPKDRIPFSFTLKTAARTSAGVFSKDSVLLRTLWSGVDYPAGSHQQTWDGLDDEGRLMAEGSYDIRVLSNNVNYTWEGVIGNSSFGISKGNNTHRAFLRMQSMAISGTNAYFGVGYAEGHPSQAKFTIDNPQSRIEFSPKGETAQATLFTATDGTTVYWAGYDGPGNGNSWFIYGTNTSDDKEKLFPRGISLKTTLGKTYASCLDVIRETNGTITGLAVQKNGSYLFVSHKAKHQIRVYNKTTGALVQTLFFNDAAGLAVDGQDQLWVINGVTVRKYIVETDGNLTETKVSLTGLERPMALAVSPDNGTVLVADGGESQQLKAYNNVSGVSSWTLGQPGGYATDPTVSNDKFYFSDISGTINDTFVAFQADGSFWVGDSGNYRAQHYSASRTFIDRIQYMQHSYSSGVDQNNPRRVFCQYLEFDVDYAKPLAFAWTLVKNWRASIPGDYFDEQNINHTFITDVFKSVTTLSNNRTYGLLKQTKTKKWSLVELPKSGPVRFTGITFDDAQYYLAPDGSLNQTISQPSGVGGNIRWQKKLLAGFDPQNNPLWSPALRTASIPVISATDPIDFTGYGSMRPGLTTANGTVVSFNKNKVSADKSNGFGFHLGGIKPGTTNWAWKTAYATTEDYTGNFPPDGAYDVGNSVEYGGGDVTVSGRHIFWSYHGEFWKNSQTNKWNHVYENGLFVGQFGVLGTEANGQAAFPGMAGNVLYGTAVAGSDGSIYIWHAEEAGHSGVHRWKVTGLETIQQQSIPVSLTRTRPNGLLGTYAEGVDLNNANARLIQVDKLVNVTWSESPIGARLSALPSFSVRWSGFVTPQYSEQYTFYVNATKGVRLWIDNKLLIDQPTTNGSTEYNGSISLDAHKQYMVRLESYGGSGAIFSWSSKSQSKEIIPSKYLYPPVETDTTHGIDLLEGLTASSILTNDLYGWKRSPAQEDYSDPNAKFWTARTTIKKYDRFTSPDLFICFRQNSGNYTITRSLGSSTNLSTSWRLQGVINQEGNFFSIDEGRNRNGGSYIELLDDADKVISRINCQVTMNPTPIGRIYGNDKIIAQGDYNNVISPIFNSAQPLDITMVNGTAVIKYGPYNAVSASVLDPAANWHKPRTLRIYFWGNGYNVNRVVDIEQMRFYANNSPSVVLLNADDEANTLAATTPSVQYRILVSENGGPYLPYTRVINVGNQTRPEGYWKFKLDAPGGEVVNSPAFTASADIKFSVYPNPTQGILYINHPIVEGDCRLRVFAPDGKEITSWVPATGTSNSAVDVTTFVKGTYVLQFQKNQTSVSTRFIR
ncbi:PA14 domain-containing protein [Spirosoma sp.]|uniref:PA14 domain-containing protein n=1 Tax=Spirosoma sp. TaxID=1899569 RepID=UPI0026292D16|nr:PA14 domain-containing protein [Spirosoma sp.]MCX6219070.1 PA14 domain-containing protein [Spirosoma sp.]